MSDRFTFLCSDETRLDLEFVANKLQRSQSDTIRMLIHHVARELRTNGELDLVPLFFSKRPSNSQVQDISSTTV